VNRKTKERAPSPTPHPPGDRESSTEAQPAAPPASGETPLFPVVGIGASAGGLAAFEAFFSAMAKDDAPGMAYVLVQHLAPDHESALPDILRRFTAMPVTQAADGMVVAVNNVYVNPSNGEHPC
jgi:two-component system, chemotaxis family, CheB/CheR fusion protein